MPPFVKEVKIYTFLSRIITNTDIVHEPQCTQQLLYCFEPQCKQSTLNRQQYAQNCILYKTQCTQLYVLLLNNTVHDVLQQCVQHVNNVCNNVRKLSSSEVTIQTEAIHADSACRTKYCTMQYADQDKAGGNDLPQPRQGGL